MKVICEICTEHIANVNMKDMDLPMKGWMFKSPDTVHGFDPPFLPDTTWEDMRCGYCNQRPFTKEDGFMSDTGYMRVRKQEEPMFVCEVCGKECASALGLGSHMRSHKGM